MRLSLESFSGDALDGARRRVSPGIVFGSALFAGSVRLDPGIAADLSDGRLVLSPEVSVAWLPSSAARLWGRLGRGFRAPTFGDLYFRSLHQIRANPDLLPERVTLEAELGASGQVSLGRLVGRGSLVGWSRTTRNPIVWIPSSAAVWSPRNLGTLEARGLEIGAGVETRKRAGWGFRARVAGVLHRSRVGFGSNGNPLPYQPDISGQLVLGVWKGTVGAGVSLHYTGARSTSLAATRTLPGFWVTDLSAQRSVDVGRFALGVFARIENVWDRQYELTELFPEPGRRFSLRLEARKVGS
jgi:outer membrane receptor protein involved in Fe transport